MRKRRPVYSIVALGCAVLMASPSWAAIVVPGQGDLTINQGKGFKPVTRQINANVGDSVMVRPGGAATVVYDDGCKVNVQPGAVTTIAPISPCASGSNAQDWRDWCRPDPSHPDQTPDCGWNWGFWAIYGGGLGFIIYEIVRPTHNPSSP